VGILFIAATVASSLGIVLLGSILDTPDYLVNTAANESQVLIGVLLWLVDCAAVVAIPVLLFPILKKHSKTLAFGYLSSRIIESVIFIVRVVFILLLISLSQEYVKSGGPAAYPFQTLGVLLLAARDWTLWLGAGIVFSLTAVILNYLLYRTKLIPRFISVWGFIGAILFFVASAVKPFGFNLEILFVPIAVQEMAFAVWLIVKGFNPSAIKA
jgi:hypothetical protein